MQEVERRDRTEVRLINESRLPDQWLALSSMNAADESSSLSRCLNPQPLDKQVSAAKLGAARGCLKVSLLTPGVYIQQTRIPDDKPTPHL